jgi:hypothetical protein
VETPRVSTVGSPRFLLGQTFSTVCQAARPRACPVGSSRVVAPLLHAGTSAAGFPLCRRIDKLFCMFGVVNCRRGLPVFALAILLGGGWCGAAPATDPDRGGRLDLPGGGAVQGRLVPAPAAAGGVRDTLLWQATAFETPFEFQLDAIRGIRFPRPAAAAAGGPWRIMLQGGDLLTGDLEAIDADRVTVRLGGDGRQRLRIARAAIDRIVRAAPGVAAGFVGPGGLQGWTQTPAGSWAETAGGIRSGVAGATVARDVGGPRRAIYDMVLAWQRRPGGSVAVAAAASGKTDPYELELFTAPGDDRPVLVLVREERDRAATEPLPDVSVAGDASRRCRVVLFVDQDRGRLAVVLPDRGPEPAAEVTIPPAAAGPSGRFRLTSAGDLELESLRVTEWTAEEPKLERPTEPIVVRRDGTRVGGGVELAAADGADLRVSAAAADVAVPVADVREIVFPEGPAAGPAPPPAAVRASCGDAATVGGDLVRVDTEAVWLRREAIDEPVGLPLRELTALESRRAAAEPSPPPGRVGRLRATGVDARGALVAVDGGVGWQPEGSRTAAKLAVRPAAGAVLEYVERPAADGPATEHAVGGLGAQVNQNDEGFFVIVMMRDDGAAALDGRIVPGDRIMAIAPEQGSRYVETQGLQLEVVMNLLRGRIGSQLRLKVTANDGTDPREVELVRGTLHVTSAEILQAALAEHARLAPGAAPAAGAGFPALAFLRTGDVLPCAVEAIDADGLRIRTPLAAAANQAAVQVPAALVQAVELIPSAASRTLDRARMDRLLTVPRLQRANPPTHLLRLTDGDYLRGRLLRLDDTMASLALADAVQELPRDAVARVIWLHPQELADGPAAPDAAAAAGPGLLVQGVAADGRRVTLLADRVDGTTIVGRSPAIGPAAIDSGTVDRLLIGAAIEAEAGTLDYRQWKLKPAPEPRALRKPAEG